MALPEFTKDVEKIQGLSDRPNEIDGLTPDQLKKKFDDNGIEFKEYINDVLTKAIDDLISKIDRRMGTSNAPFSELETYKVGDVISHELLLYKCHTAVITPGAWTGIVNWEETSILVTDEE